MTDKEKVKNGLYHHCVLSMFDRCSKCPYYEATDEPFQCRDALLMDAFFLLIEQEPLRPDWSNGKAFCGNCGKPFPRNRGEQRRFCSYCGQEVQWE